MACGDSGIGRAVAVLFARESAEVTIDYMNENGDSRVTLKAIEREGRRCILIQSKCGNRPFANARLRHEQEVGAIDSRAANAARPDASTL